MNSNAVLQTRELCIQYPGQGSPVLHDITLNIEAGEKIALFGLNGSGKSSLLRAILGLIPSQGEIMLHGKQLEKRTRDYFRTNIGLLCNVPEEQLLMPEVLADITLSLPSSEQAKPANQKRLQSLLDKLELTLLTHKNCYELSHGQKLRVALAGLFIKSPHLLLLDEPNAGLDPIGSKQLIRLLQQEQTPMLIASHDLTFLQAVCSRWILLRGQTIHAQGNHMPQSAKELWPEIECL